MRRTLGSGGISASLSVLTVRKQSELDRFFSCLPVRLQVVRIVDHGPNYARAVIQLHTLTLVN